MQGNSSGKIPVQSFFDPTTFTYSYVVQDPGSLNCAVIDSVLDYDAASGVTSTRSADAIIAFVQDKSLKLEWVLDTHIHADHLSAAQYLKDQLGGQTAIGEDVGAVQSAFAKIFNLEADFKTNGAQFDRLFSNGSSFKIGNIGGSVMHTPGHTPACLTYLFDGFAFVGDTLFMPDYGTARTDFPGGDAATLYSSIQKILTLPADTVLYMCHDYGTDIRKEFTNKTTVTEQRTQNIHIHEGVSAVDFVTFRESRDADLRPPALLYPAVQFNMRAGMFPNAESNGTRYFKIPVREQ